MNSQIIFTKGNATANHTNEFIYNTLNDACVASVTSNSQTITVNVIDYAMPKLHSDIVKRIVNKAHGIGLAVQNKV